MHRTKAPAPLSALAWDDVRIFLALGRSRTVGQAARRLGVDGSTVSRRLAAMEQVLATTLFDRGREGVSRTKAADDLMPVAEEMEGVMARFTHAVEGLEREISGLVRITCPPDVAAVVVAPLLGEVFRRHPSLEIALDPGEAVLDIARREADIALRTVRPARGDLVVTKLFTARWVLAASPAMARRLGKLRSWEDTAWIAWGERLAGIGAARWLAKHGGAAPRLLRSDSLVVHLEAAAAGVGVALVPEPSVEHYRLARVELAAPLREAASSWPTDELYLVTHRALRDVPRVRAVWDLLAERLGPRGR